MKRTILIVVLAMLAGCQTTSPDMPPDPGIACINSLANRPDLAVIAGKIALASPAQQAFEMLSNTSKPNDVEKTAIAEWVKGKQVCFDMTREWRAQYNLPPTLAAIQDAVISEFLNHTADLYNGKLTYGEYTKARSNSNAKYNQQWAEAAQHLRDMQAAADEQRRNRALMYLLSQQPRTQPSVSTTYQMPIPRTTTTNCYVVGNQMNCTSR